jgi:hypothetical protein
MANTTFLKEKVEPHVREWLAEKFGKPFGSKFLPLVRVEGTAKTHEFDAVSEDKKIVCGIKTASWKTGGGRRGAGKIQGAYAEIYFLDHVDAQEKYLVLTDPEFFENLTRNSQGRLPADIRLLYCKLSEELKKEVDEIRVASRRELGF